MISFIKSLIAPPGCVGCGERFSVFDDSFEKAFCPDCRSKWERAKRSVCNGCKRENAECICGSKSIKNTKILSLIKFGKDNSCDKLIYALKRRRNKRFFDFAADELYKRLRREEKLIMIDLSKAIYTNVPRNMLTKNSFGFDHAEILAVSVADKIGGRYINLLSRRWGGRPQKKLGEEARRENVKDRFDLNDTEEIKGETVVLIDDVVTTGATAAECIKILRQNGAAEVILLTLARTEKAKRRNKNKYNDNERKQ